MCVRRGPMPELAVGTGEDAGGPMLKRRHRGARADARAPGARRLVGAADGRGLAAQLGGTGMRGPRRALDEHERGALKLAAGRRRRPRLHNTEGLTRSNSTWWSRSPSANRRGVAHAACVGTTSALNGRPTSPRAILDGWRAPRLVYGVAHGDERGRRGAGRLRHDPPSRSSGRQGQNKPLGRSAPDRMTAGRPQGGNEPEML